MILQQTFEKALAFLDRMFQDRSYQLSTKTDHQYDIEHHYYVVEILDAKDRKVRVLLTNICSTKDSTNHFTANSVCQEFGDSKELEDKTGTQFIRDLVQRSVTDDVYCTIIITDNITTQAAKILTTHNGPDRRFSYFTYSQTAFTNMAQHDLQPTVFRALSPEEKVTFVRSHPRYQTELWPYPHNDPLVRYYGLQVGDIIYVEDNDRQTALSPEYGLVVLRLDPVS